jgi:small nuclear ribonucleoprotein D3
MSIGVPIKLMHEAEGHTVTIELKSGEIFRGFLVESEDNMNCQLSGITFTARDGRMSELEHAYIRGSKIRFMILPDMLKNAPMFKTILSRGPKKGVGIGRGRGGPKRGKSRYYMKD